MLAILHLLVMFIADRFKPRRRHCHVVGLVGGDPGR
jgi:hypothetical protein